MFFPSRARLASWHPPVQRRRNLENSAVPTLLARGSRLAFRATMCRAEGDLEACSNRILTIFDPYTFSHSQGQGRSSDRRAWHVRYSATKLPMLLHRRDCQVRKSWRGRQNLFSMLESGHPGSTTSSHTLPSTRSSAAGSLRAKDR